jgi:hypothetical protein
MREHRHSSFYFFDLECSDIYLKMALLNFHTR